MAVLVEAISVVIRKAAIHEKYPGGWDAFTENAPNQTLCADSSLARVGFMTPIDVETYIKYLEKKGLTFLEDGEACDFVVVDQQRGFTSPCKWAAFGHVNLDDDPAKRVAGCRLLGGPGEPLLQPYGWKYEGSLSQTYGFVPVGSEDKSLKFLRHEDGMDVYLNLLTGKEVYMGRVSEK